MKRLVVILMVIPLLVGCNKKTVFSLFEQDRQNYDLTEWIDGEEWVYKDNGKFRVGVTIGGNYNYTLKVLILNKSGQTVLFEPGNISAHVAVQSREQSDVIKRLKLYSGSNSEMLVSTSGLTYDHSPIDNLLQDTSTIYSLGAMTKDYRLVKEIRYLRKTTLYTDKVIYGYVYLENSDGRIMFVDIPVGGDVFSFKWMMLRK